MDCLGRFHQEEKDILSRKSRPPSRSHRKWEFFTQFCGRHRSGKISCHGKFFSLYNYSGKGSFTTPTLRGFHHDSFIVSYTRLEPRPSAGTSCTWPRWIKERLLRCGDRKRQSHWGRARKGRQVGLLASVK